MHTLYAIIGYILSKVFRKVDCVRCLPFCIHCCECWQRIFWTIHCCSKLRWSPASIARTPCSSTTCWTDFGLLYTDFTAKSQCQSSSSNRGRWRAGFLRIHFQYVIMVSILPSKSASDFALTSMLVPLLLPSQQPAGTTAWKQWCNDQFCIQQQLRCITQLPQPCRIGSTCRVHA